MKKTVSLTSPFIALLLALTLAFAALPVSANHPVDIVEESENQAVKTSNAVTAVTNAGDEAKIQQMQALIEVLKKLIDLLQHQAEHKVNEDHAADDHEDEEDDHEDDHDDDDHEDEDHDDNDDDHDENN